MMEDQLDSISSESGTESPQKTSVSFWIYCCRWKFHPKDIRPSQWKFVSAKPNQCCQR